MPCMRADENRRKDLFYFLSDERAFFFFLSLHGICVESNFIFSSVCVCDVPFPKPVGRAFWPKVNAADLSKRRSREKERERLKIQSGRD